MQLLSKEQRLLKLITEVENSGKVDMRSLGEKFDVSIDTIRRDIKELHDKGLLKAIRGGAIAHSPIPKPFRDRLNFDSEEKKIIALKAVKLLQNDQTIILDGGTSTLALANNIPTEIRLTVVTNSFPIVNVLESHPNIDILFAGGRLRKMGFDTAGTETIRMYESIRADLCFMSVYSIHHKIGITAKEYEDAELKRSIVKYAQKVVALATASKTDTAEAFFVCDMDAIDFLVTDVDPLDEKMRMFREFGLNVI
ncbi:DeoR/GlpR transcriptional regulator [Mucilaginibacter sp. JRF]|uniref:DeoR/GlpR family DNA-binding transcription regulator n=1 Tax=Mucilaginibacter sp. JRF TaxID=2780088 RepID=UPI00187E0AB5|nr:DeoR/GlpR family DNA-binding transcription regulator [Mucilaginibacter sp. JRF]MBE9583881.1 DeoR/GlpR transcriptional regulator [Mucilaginibacter sp. JRF]